MKEYEDALSGIKVEPQNPSIKDIENLLETDARYFRQSALLCDKLRKTCRAYWRAAKGGDVTAAQQESVIEILEELAQIGENHVERRRNILTALHNHVISVGRKISGDIPVQGHGTPVIIEHLDEKEIVRIEMPGIVPFKQKRGTSYLYGKVAYFMSEFMLKMQREKNSRITFPYASITIIHHYIEGKKSQYLPDYDNLEKSCVINAMQTCGLFSDNSEHMEVFETTSKASRNFTEVLVAPVSRFKEIYAGLDISMYGMEGVKKPSESSEAHQKNC